MDENGRTKEKVRVLLSQGFTPRDLSLQLGITPQRVYVVMAKLRKEALAENESA
jgi:hypothetical protein